MFSEKLTHYFREAWQNATNYHKKLVSLAQKLFFIAAEVSNPTPASEVILYQLNISKSGKLMGKVSEFLPFFVAHHRVEILSLTRKDLRIKKFI